MPDEKPDTESEKLENASAEHFDKTEFYERVLRPQIEALQKLCQDNEVPMIISTCFVNNADNMELMTAGSWGPNRYVPPSYFLARALIKDDEHFLRVAAFARLVGVRF